MSLDKGEEKAQDKYYPGYGYRPHADDCICDPYYGCQCNDYPYGVTALDKAEDKYYPGYGYRPHADDCICDPYYGCQCNDYPYGGVMSLDQAKPAEKTQGKYFYGPYNRYCFYNPEFCYRGMNRGMYGGGYGGYYPY